MSHFAKIENGIVVQVIVAEQEIIDSRPGEWVQASYNTRGGQHPKGRSLRKNYAGIGFTYDRQRDAFIPPKPYPSWALDETSCQWRAPVSRPDDGKAYVWDEASLSWVV